MRRHSLIGPLILVLLGVLFLAHNLHPEWVSFTLIATYWPFLLIAWGLLRLVEVVYWKLSSKPLPARGVSGGEWTLIVLICLIGSGLFLWQTHRPRLPRVFVEGRGVEIFGQTYDYAIAEQRQAVKVPRILIDNPRGNTRLVGADTQEVKVSGRRTIRSYSQSQADEANQKTALNVSTEGDQLVIRSTQGPERDEMRISTDLEITVPRGAVIHATGRYGDFDILNIDGGVEVTSGNAGVRLQDLGGSVRVDLRRSDMVRALNVKGNVEILGRGQNVELENIGGSATINGHYSGDILCRNLSKPLIFQSGITELRAERVPGQFHLTLRDFTASNLVGPVRLTAQSKDVNIQGFQGEMAVTLQRGDVNLQAERAPDAKIDVTTGSGDLELALPSDARFEVSATTGRGQVENDFPPLDVSLTNGGGSARGTTGGGPKFTLHTDRGRIALRKR